MYLVFIIYIYVKYMKYYIHWTYQVKIHTHPPVTLNLLYLKIQLFAINNRTYTKHLDHLT